MYVLCASDVLTFDVGYCSTPPIAVAKVVRPEDFIGRGERIWPLASREDNVGLPDTDTTSLL